MVFSASNHPTKQEVIPGHSYDPRKRWKRGQINFDFFGPFHWYCSYA